MTKFKIENFRTARASVGYVAWFDVRLADVGILLDNISLKRPEKLPRELWVFLPTRANCRTEGIPAYRLEPDLRRAIGEAATATYRAATGVDAHYVAPPRVGGEAPACDRRPHTTDAGIAHYQPDDAAGVRRVLGAVEETMIAAGCEAAQQYM